jgi:thioredoxin reductase
LFGCDLSQPLYLKFAAGGGVKPLRRKAVTGHRTPKKVGGSVFDVIIVGAGPAGLSAALVLGRCRRRVLVCDAGQPRNISSHGLHCYLTRDGIAPAEFLRIARDQLVPYETVELRQTQVTDARRLAEGFEVITETGERLTARKLLLATGVVDDIPQLDGLAEFYGRSVFHCPYCDGWEMRDQPLAVYGRGENGAGLALELMLWSRNLVLCTDGPSQLSEVEVQRLADNKIPVRQDRIKRLEGNEGTLRRVVFDNGDSIDVRGMFFSTGQRQASDLAEKLGCEITDQGCVATGDYEKTDIPGLYVAGDASRLVQFVIVAAAEGALAAVAINKELMQDDLK